MRARYSITAALAALLAGCAVGPNFKQPAAPEVSGYTPAPLSTTIGTTNVTGGEPQRFVSGGDIPGEWWTLFHSKPLNKRRFISGIIPVFLRFFECLHQEFCTKHLRSLNQPECCTIQCLIEKTTSG